MIIGIDIRNIGRERTGDEAVFFNLVKNLAVIDFQNEYHLFTDITDRGKLGKIKKDLEIENKDNFQIISLKTKNRFTWNFWALSAYLRKNPVDIYVTQYITPWFVPKRIKIITIIHDISFNFYPQFIKKSDLIFLKFLMPMSLKRADKIIGVSKFTHDEIIKYYKINPAKVDFIHNAVSQDFSREDATAEKVEKAKEKYGLPSNYILYLGTLQPRKNIPTLIEAFSKIKENFSDFKLVVAGGKSHNYDERIDKTIKKHNLFQDVIFPGFIEEKDKAAVMAGAQIFCFPSQYEGFGIPILEAMSVDVPVVVSDIGPHREVAGEAASFFSANNSDELIEKILEILSGSEIRDILIKKGKERTCQFSWPRAAEKMLEIFKNI